MPFFKELRRRTTGHKLNKNLSQHSSEGTSDSNGTVPTTKSSSTLNSVYGSSTPPSTVQPNASTPNLANSKSSGANGQLSQRPIPVSMSSSRLSVMVRLHQIYHRIIAEGYITGRGCSISQWELYEQATDLAVCSSDNIDIRELMGQSLRPFLWG